MASKESQDVLKEFGRPIYDRLIAEHPVEVQLPPQKLVARSAGWDQKSAPRKRNSEMARATLPMRFAAIGLDHRHIYHLVEGLLDAGLSCAGTGADQRPARARGLSLALSGSCSHRRIAPH